IHFLVLSGGVLWTGPAISTVLDGESTVDVMNAMGYRAAALGNHDFDFGLENVIARSEQANFPILAANLRDRETGAVPDFVQPFTVLEINGIHVGLIGLTTQETPWDTQPSVVAGFEFIAYKDALREAASQARLQGAELLIVIGHICASEMRLLAPLAAELGVAMIGGGHCHEEINETVNGVALVQSGSFMQAYVKVDLYFDTASDQVVRIKSNLQPNRAGKADQAIARRVDGWRARIDPRFWQPVGYAAQEIGRKSEVMRLLITAAWLAAWPEADAALINLRYIQQPIPAGEITPARLIDVLPTRNTLVEMDITGAQLIEIIETYHPLVGGVEASPDRYHFSDGEAISPEASYQVLIPKALFDGGSYYEVKKYDPDASDTGVDWRQAVEDYLISLESSRQQPIERVIGDK
ncbi:MAG: bifunctional metallophosphatase/5'-nucleotidase, partial [Chloroflexota bacterium]